MAARRSRTVPVDSTWARWQRRCRRAGLVPLWLAVVATTLLCAWLANALVQKAGRDAIEANLRFVSQAQAERLAQYLSIQRHSLQALAADPSVRGAAVAPGPPGSTTAEALILQYERLGRPAGIGGGWLMRVDGDEPLMTFGKPAAGSFAEVVRREQVQAVVGQVDELSAPDDLRLSEFDTGDDGQLRRAYYALPVFSAGRAVAVLVARFDVQGALAHLRSFAPTGAAPVQLSLQRAGSALAAAGLAAEIAAAAERDPQGFGRYVPDGRPALLVAHDTVPILDQRLLLLAATEDRGSWVVTAPMFWRLGLAASLVLLLVSALALRSAAHRRGGVHPKVVSLAARIGQGDYDSRANLGRHEDAFGLGQVLDRLLDERARPQRELPATQAALASLQRTLEQIVSSRDPHLRMPIEPSSEGVIGELAGAINRVLDEVGGALSQAQGLGQQLARATAAAKTDTEAATDSLLTQRQVLDEAVKGFARQRERLGSLVSASNGLTTGFAALREGGAQAAGQLDESAHFVSRMRELLALTEKRIKQLGERSLEISEIVSIIHTIAERTRVVALNASLKAAEAGLSSAPGGGFFRRGAAPVRLGARIGRSDPPPGRGDPPRNRAGGHRGQRGDRRSGPPGRAGAGRSPALAVAGRIRASRSGCRRDRYARQPRGCAVRTR
ncbi:MAG: methyl-accepting chemotaxis protein [Burkholderiaceae bacterium]